MPKMYPHYLETDCWWRQIRRMALERAKFVCEARFRCDGAPATECHHWTYARIGNEAPFDVAAVCGACHRFLHLPAPALPVAANDNRQLELPLLVDKVA